MEWFFIALAGSWLFAIVNILDLLFFDDGIYVNPVEPAVTSGGLQLLVWLFLPYFGFHVGGDVVAIFLAVLAGMLNVFAYLLYFEAVFASRDSVMVVIFWNLLLIAVPILAFFVVKEDISSLAYIGIVAIFLGVNLLAFSGVDKKEGMDVFKKVATRMVLAVILMAFSIVFLKGAYQSIPYWEGYVLFAGGMALGSVLLFMIFLKRSQKKRFLRISTSFLWLFLIIEGVNVGAEVLSSYALSLGPASLITAIESSQAVLMMVTVVLLYVGMRYFHIGSSLQWRELYESQLSGWRLKMCAVALTVLGAFLVTL